MRILAGKHLVGLHQSATRPTAELTYMDAGLRTPVAAEETWEGCRRKDEKLEGLTGGRSLGEKGGEKGSLESGECREWGAARVRKEGEYQVRCNSKRDGPWRSGYEAL